LKKYLFLFFCVFTSGTLRAQKVQWASTVLGYSTQAIVGGQAQHYSVKQLLGPPSKLPAFGNSVCAWQPLHTDFNSDDWAKVSFDTAQVVNQIIVAENFGQGAMYKIFLYDTNGKEYLVFTETQETSVAVGRNNVIFLEKPTPYLVKALKIVLNTARVRGANQIDAVGISADEIPYNPQINVSTGKDIETQKENLGKTVNSPTNELAPVISPDGKYLYFTRENHPSNLGDRSKLQDIWVSENFNGKWLPAVNLGKPLNNDDNNATCAISADGRKLYLLNIYEGDHTAGRGVSYSNKLKRNKWQAPVPLAIKNLNIYPEANTAIYKYGFTVSTDGKILITTMKSRNTQGETDLYVSFQKSDSTWTEPMNLGPSLNTPENEDTPFLASDNRTLYFSTAGYPGYGSNDIFVTRRLDDSWKKWSYPVNLGPKVNSAAWDGYFSISASGDYAYLCSQQESFGLEDIFRIKIKEENKPDKMALVSGTVTDRKTNKVLEAEVFAVNMQKTTDTLKANFVPELGEYKLLLPLKGIYKIMATKTGYLPLSENLDLSKQTVFKEINLPLKLQAIEVGETSNLEGINFAVASADLLPESYVSLGKIIEYLQSNNTLYLHLDGHTDIIGDPDANLALSGQRVESVKKYLVKNGLDAKRITTKAWGGSKPLVAKGNDQERMKNRRVEFTIKKAKN
jgi:outer membrane protein OmpA-like peptidoglycan-associated protein